MDINDRLQAIRLLAGLILLMLLVAVFIWSPVALADDGAGSDVSQTDSTAVTSGAGGSAGAGSAEDCNCQDGSGSSAASGSAEGSGDTSSSASDASPSTSPATQAAPSGGEGDSTQQTGGAGEGAQVPATAETESSTSFEDNSELICGTGQWGADGASSEEKWDDYYAGILTVNYQLTNTSSDLIFYNVKMTGATATNGVTLYWPSLPLLLDSMFMPSEVEKFYLKWQLPSGAGGGFIFTTSLTICADEDKEELCPDGDCDDDEEELCPDGDCDDGDETFDDGDGSTLTGNDLTRSYGERAALPSTGFEMTAAALLGLALLLLGSCILFPEAVRVRSRKR